MSTYPPHSSVVQSHIHSECRGTSEGPGDVDKTIRGNKAFPKGSSTSPINSESYEGAMHSDIVGEKEIKDTVGLRNLVLD